MQITSVTIWKILPMLGLDMSLNDVCVMAPAWSLLRSKPPWRQHRGK
jgi:hypothetical protein